MRSIWRTLGSGLARDIALVCAAAGVVGVSFGAITVSADLPIWLPSLLSVLVFAGAAQFMFVGIVAAGGGPVAALVAALLINIRHVPFGFAVSDLLGNRPWQRVVGSYLMVDETVAFALGQDDAKLRRAAYWACGVGLFVSWNIGVLAGAFGGTVVSDTDALGLDAAFPAVLLALIMPMLKDSGTRNAALVGSALAVGTAFVLPAGLPVLVALLGVLAMIRKRKSVVPS